MTGVAQRTISSTAVGATPSKSAIHMRCWSGWSVSACIPWLMALRVVSLPADDEQDEERAELRGGEPLAVDLGVHQRRRDVVAGVVEPLLAELLRVGPELVGGPERDVERRARTPGSPTPSTRLVCSKTSKTNLNE